MGVEKKDTFTNFLCKIFFFSNSFVFQGDKRRQGDLIIGESFRLSFSITWNLETAIRVVPDLTTYLLTYFKIYI